MRLIIIADESVYEQDVDPSVEVQDVIALIEAETGISSEEILLTTDTGTPLASPTRSLESYGLQGETATLYLTSPSQAGPSSQSGNISGSGGADQDAEIERMRLQVLGNPELMFQIRQSNPEMYEAVQAGGRQFVQALERHQRIMQEIADEKYRQTELLNADPYDIDAQKRIEETIRRERVNENADHALTYAPETFAEVTMLYIDVEVNGHMVKAFVDSGAQRTIISPDCAEACGIMRLLDDRYAGLAVGVGTANILGRIHSAQIRIGSLYLPCAFLVLEGKGVDLLLGLDMLKRYQCNIDLAANVLRIQSTSVPFLAEHELPSQHRKKEIQAGREAANLREAEEQLGLKSALDSGSAGPSSSSAKVGGFPGGGNKLGAVAGSRTISQSASNASGGSTSGSGTMTGPPGTVDAARMGRVKEDDVQTLVGLGAERQQAISLLEATGGNVDYAASMLFGGGAQWP